MKNLGRIGKNRIVLNILLSLLYMNRDESIEKVKG